MRILGQGQYPSHITTTTQSLLQFALAKPEAMWQTLPLYRSNATVFSSLLARKGLTASTLYGDMSGKNGLRSVGNSILEWAIKAPPLHKGSIISHDGGSTPGLNGATFNIVCDVDKFKENMVLELVDQRTFLWVRSRTQTAQNTWTYNVSLKYNVPGAFADPTLLTAGKEIGFSHSNYPEISSDAFEMHSGMEWHRNYMTIQRIKYTMSGSARATKTIIEHNGAYTWESRANLEMMEHWYSMQEAMYLFGVATKDAANNVYLRDLDGKEVIAGDGLIASGDSGLKFGYNRLTDKVIKNVLYNMHQMQTSEGVQEYAVICGKQFAWEFSQLMADVFAANPQPLYEMKNGQRGVNTGFSFYEPYPNVRMFVLEHPHFDSPYLPQEFINGRNPRSGRAIFTSLGNTIGGTPNVQLVALGNGQENRSMILRAVPGMVGPGISQDGRMQVAVSSVDAYQVHALSETALVLRNPYGVAELFQYRN